MNIRKYIENQTKKDQHFVVAAIIAATIGIPGVIFQEQIHVWVNAHFGIVALAMILGIAWIEGEDFVNKAGATMLYFGILVGVILLLRASVLPPMIEVAMAMAAVIIFAWGILRMPEKGSALERFFHGKRLVIKLEPW